MSLPAPPWRAPFLAVLAQHGSVVRAAAAVGITPRGAYKARGREAGFAADWEAALERWRGRLGAELAGRAVDAMCEIGGQFGGVQRPRVQRTPRPRIGPETLLRFLDHLAACASVRRSAATCGVTAQALYMRRRHCPDFRAAWDAALETGRVRLEGEMLRATLALFDPEFDDPRPPVMMRRGERVPVEPEVVAVTMDDAFRLMGMARGKPSTPRRSPPLGEVRDSILRKIAAIERVSAMEEREAAGEAAGAGAEAE